MSKKGAEAQPGIGRSNEERLSDDILYFLQANTDPTCVDEDWAVYNAAALSEEQLERARPLFEANDVPMPNAVTFVKILPSPKHWQSRDPARARGLACVRMDYDDEHVVGYGGVLSRKGYAPYPEKHVTIDPLLTEESVTDYAKLHTKLRRENPRLYAEMYAKKARNVARWLLLGVAPHRVEISESEFELLHELAKL